MAVRVQNGESLNFGTFSAEVTVTHARVGFGSQTLVVRPLATDRTVAAGREPEFLAGDIQLVFPSGEMEDTGLSALLGTYFSQAVWVDLMTDPLTVVSDSGYSQQTSSTWNRSVESD